MAVKKKYPLDPHGDGMVSIPKWEYDVLKEIARMHSELLSLVENELPEVGKKFRAISSKQ